MVIDVIYNQLLENNKVLYADFSVDEELFLSERMPIEKRFKTYAIVMKKANPCGFTIPQSHAS